MSRSVTGTLPESVEVLIAKLEKAAKKHDIHFEGNNTHGFAKGKGFHVKYQVDGEQCTITVSKKPFLIPWSVVEGALAKIF